MRSIRQVHRDAVTWEDFMPKRGNGGVPQHQEVDHFRRAIKGNDELRQKVMGELRELAGLRAAYEFALLTATLALYAVVASLVIRPLDALEGESWYAEFATVVLGMAGIGVAAFLFLSIRASLVLSRARHASSYLEAYSEVLSRPKTATRPRWLQ